MERTIEHLCVRKNVCRIILSVLFIFYAQRFFSLHWHVAPTSSLKSVQPGTVLLHDLFLPEDFH